MMGGHSQDYYWNRLRATMRAGQMVPRTSAELQLDREMHAAFCRLADMDGRVPSEAISDIRRQQQHPWRVLARRIVECARAGVPLSAVLFFLKTLETFARRVYARYGNAPTPESVRVLPFRKAA